MKSDIISADKYYFDNPDVWSSLSLERYCKESEFICSLLSSRRAQICNILDIGCGTGEHLSRITGDLNANGLGIDANRKMIDYAKIMYPHLCWQVGNMLEINNQGDFDLLLCLCSTFSYATEGNDIDMLLSIMHRSLGTHGTLVLDVVNAIAWITNHDYQEELSEDVAVNGRHIRFNVRHSLDHDEQILHEDREVTDHKSGEMISRERGSLRIYFPQEIRYMLKHHGFSDICLYGDYSRDSGLSNAYRMVVVAHKT